MSLKFPSSQSACFEGDPTLTSQGITFHLPSRRRFIPYSWLLYAEVNEAQTELYLHYSHCVVTVVGTDLGALHKSVGQFHLRMIRELPSTFSAQSPSVSRIEIAEKSEG